MARTPSQNPFVNDVYTAAEAPITDASVTVADYSASVDPETIWSNSSFLADARSYLSERGYDVSTDEKVKDAFYELRSYRDLNSVSMLRDAAEAYGADETTRARDRRLIEVWNRLPSFWEDGGRGLSAIPDIGAAVLTDPLNLIPVGGPAAAAASKAAIQAGKGVGTALARGVIASVPREVAFNAAIGAGSDVAIQARDNALGLQEGFDVNELLASTALAGAAGAVGAPLNILDARAGVNAGRAAMTAEEAAAREASQAALDLPEGQTELPMGGETPAPVQRSPIEAVIKSIDDELSSLRDNYGPTESGAIEQWLVSRSAEARKMRDVLKYADGLRSEIAAFDAQPQLTSADFEKLTKLRDKLTELETQNRELFSANTPDMIDDYLDERLKTMGVSANSRSQDFPQVGGDANQQPDLFGTDTGTPPERSPGLDPQMFEADPVSGQQVPKGQAQIANDAMPEFIDSTALYIPDGNGGQVLNPVHKNTELDPDWTPPADTGAVNPVSATAEGVDRLVQMGLDAPAARRMVIDAYKQGGIENVDALVRQYEDDDIAGTLLDDVFTTLGDASDNRDVVMAYVNSAPNLALHREAIMARWDTINDINALLSDVAANPDQVLQNAGGKGKGGKSGVGGRDYLSDIFDRLDIDGLEAPDLDRVGRSVHAVRMVMEGTVKSVKEAQRLLDEGVFDVIGTIPNQQRQDMLVAQAQKLIDDIRIAKEKVRTTGSEVNAVMDGDRQVTGRSMPTEYSRGVPGTEGAVVGGGKTTGNIQSMFKASNSYGYFGRVRTGLSAEADAMTQLDLAAKDALGVATDISTSTGNAKRTTASTNRKAIGFDAGKQQRFVTQGDRNVVDSDAQHRLLLNVSAKHKRMKADYDAWRKKVQDYQGKPGSDPKELAAKKKARLKVGKAAFEAQLDALYKANGLETPSEKKAKRLAQKEMLERSSDKASQAAQTIQRVTKQDPEEIALEAMEASYRAELRTIAKAERRRLSTEMTEKIGSVRKAMEANGSSAAAIKEIEDNLRGYYQGRIDAIGSEAWTAKTRAERGMVLPPKGSMDFKNQSDALDAEAAAIARDFVSGKITQQEMLVRLADVQKRADARKTVFDEIGGFDEDALVNAVPEHLYGLDPDAHPALDAAPPMGGSAPVQAIPEPSIPEGRTLVLWAKSGVDKDHRIARPGQSINAVLGKSSVDKFVIGHGDLKQTKIGNAVRVDRRKALDTFQPIEGQVMPGREPLPPEIDKMVDPSIDHPITGQKVSGEGLWREIFSIESAAWPKTAEEMQQRATTLAKLYDAMPDHLLPAQTRQKAMRQIEDIYQGAERRAVIALKDIIRRLRTDRAPIIEANPHGSAGYNLAGNVITVDPKYAGRGQVEDLLHEVGHWMYFNVMTPQDKAEFWRATEKFYPNAKLNQKLIRKRLAVFGPDGRPLRGDTNADVNAQEFFANQLVQYVLSGNRLYNDKSLWEKVVNIVRSVIARFFDKDLVDPDMAKLFDRLLPNDVQEGILKSPAKRAQTAKGKVTEGHLASMVKLDNFINETMTKFIVAGPVDRNQSAAFKQKVAGALNVLARELADWNLRDEIAEELAQAIGEVRKLKPETAGLIYFDKMQDVLHALDKAHAAKKLDFVKLEGHADMTTAELNRIAVNDRAKGHVDWIDQRVARIEDEIGKARVSRKQEHLFNALEDAMKSHFVIGNHWRYLDGAKRNAAERNASLALSRRIYEFLGYKTEGKSDAAIDKELAKLIAEQQRDMSVDSAMSRRVKDSGEPEGIDSIYDRAAAGEIIDEADEAIEPPMGGGGSALKWRIAGLSFDEKFDEVHGILEDALARFSSIRREVVRIAKRTDPDYVSKAAKPVGNRMKRLKEFNEQRAIAKALREAAGMTQSMPTNLSPRKMDRAALWSAFQDAVKARDGVRVTALGNEIAHRIRTKPEVPEVEVPRTIRNMKYAELVSGLTKSLISGDRKATDAFSYELWRRRNKPGQSFANEGGPLRVEDSAIRSLIQNEVDAADGEWGIDGIPPGTKGDVREFMLRMTHRDPQVQADMRTMTGRLLGLLGRNTIGTLQEANVVTMEDLARLTGQKISATARGAFADLRGPEYAALRKDERRLTIALSKGDANPIDLMHEIGHMTMRAQFSDADRQSIHTAFRDAIAAKDSLAMTVASRYSGEDMARQAEEWFVEGWAQYLGERVARGDIYKMRTGAEPIQLKGTIETMVDRLVEGVAYVLNGLIGRDDIRQMYRRLTFYGDMRAPFRNALPMGGQKTVPAMLASDHARAVMLREDMSRKAMIAKFTDDFDYNDGEPIVLYHGTLHGGSFWQKDTIPVDRLDDVYLRPSANGEHGPGIYVTSNPQVADWVYAKNATGPGSLDAFLRDDFYGHLSKKTRMKVRGLVQDLIDTRNDVAALEAMRSGRDPQNIIDAVSGEKAAASLLDGMYELPDGTFDMDALDMDIESGHMMIEGLVRQIRDISGGVEGEVLPLYIRASTPFDMTRTINVERPRAREIIEAVVEAGHTTPERISAALNSAGFSGESLKAVDGQEFYDSLSEAIDRHLGLSPNEGRKLLNQTLKEIGYDSIKARHTDTMPDGTKLDHDVFVLFEPGQVKHMEADYFDHTKNGIFLSEIDGRELIGPMHNAAVSSEGAFDPATLSETLAFQNAGGIPTEVTSAMSSIAKGIVDSKAVKALGKVRSIFSLKGSVAYVDDVIGGHWLAEKIAPKAGTGVREKQVHELASKIMPIVDAIREVTGDSRLAEWGKFVGTGGNPKQNQRISQVERALRTGDIRNLDAQQIGLYNVVRRSLDKEIEDLRAGGSVIGRIMQNYYPQVWSVEAIMRDEAGFIEKLSRYFLAEAKAEGRVLSDAAAMDKAADVARKLLSDNGVWTPPKAERRNTDMMADHQRLIRLDEPRFSENFKELEGFLERNMMTTMVRYFEQSTRRQVVTDAFGTNVHGFFDYLTVAAHGRKGIVDMLLHDKIVYSRAKEVLDDGAMHASANKVPLIKAFENPAQVNDLVDQAIAALDANPSRAEKVQAIKDVFYAVKPPMGGDKQAWARRVEAIANGLVDFGWKQGSVPRDHIAYMEQTFRRMMHKPASPGSAFYDASHTASRAIKDFNNLTLLSYTMLTSFSDVALPLVRSGNMRAATRAWRKYATDPSYRTAFRNIGASINRLVSNYGHIEDGEPARQLMNASFELTGLPKWTAMQREVASIVGFEAFADAQRVVQSRNMNGGSDRRTRVAMRTLRRYGLESFAEPNAPSLRDLSLMQSRTPEGDALRSAVIRFANETIFEPDFADKPLWAQGPFGSLIFHLKSYPLMYGRLAKWALNEAVGNGDGMKGANPAPLVYMLTIGGAVGAGTLGIKDVLQSRGGEEGTSAELRERRLSKIAEAIGVEVAPGETADKVLGWYLEGFLLVGGLGLIANSLWDIAQQQDNGYYGITRAASTIFGPAVGTFADGMHVLAGTTNAIISGEDDGTAKERQAVRSIAGRIPFVGGNIGAREAIVDAIAGEASSTGGGGGSGAGGWGGSWGGQWGGKW